MIELKRSPQCTLSSFFRNRRFSPTVFSTLLTLIGVALFLRLGFWQLDRAEEKRTEVAHYAAGQQSTLELTAETANSLPRYQHVQARGRYDSRHQILLDNMPSAQGRAGYRVLTPLRLEQGGWLLVDRGWIAPGVTREVLPRTPVDETPRTAHGRLDHLPEPGIRLRQNDAAAGAIWPRVLSFPVHEQLERALQRPLARRIVLLDATQPDGFERTWRADFHIAPGRHLAYAVQWFALALVAVVLYVIMHLKSARNGAAAEGPPENSSRFSRAPAWILAALFFAPLLIAFLLYYGVQGWRPAGSTNHGALLTPPRPLPATSLTSPAGAPIDAELLRGKWTLVYPGEGRCDARCKEALTLMRQTRVALNDDLTRVQRVFLATGECCDHGYLDAAHPGLITAKADTDAGAALLSNFPDRQSGTIYIVDPLGNLMMSYPPDAEPNGLLQDLKKLLKLSHIG